uniref:DUF501 domain-containing protein n=1 Tax=Chrysotila carterae TaxID=13221 RepID=A0A7S4BZU0_CHRCT|mmetsp:Transcript_4518/g.9804  ORF Transcript_4518/g.9804 Transcript_4518/m.9804 type:complete len:314 (-) Transcript_4518:222-1163(-)|eukprot:4642663-Pleurochrysis_carterae.AAC.1
MDAHHANPGQARYTKATACAAWNTDQTCMTSSSNPKAAGVAISAQEAGVQRIKFHFEHFSTIDEAFLAESQDAKRLDRRVRVLGVAARGLDGMPSVLALYPLRVTERDGHHYQGPASGPRALANSHTSGGSVCENDSQNEVCAEPPQRSEAKVDSSQRDTRCRGARKWTSALPVPWPNTFWLVCPTLTRRVGRLEHLGFVQNFYARLASDERAREAFADAHLSYGCTRWALLNDADKAYCEANAYTRVLRDCGVGGLRHTSQIKCLHLHYAHYLATGKNIIGEWVQEALDHEADNAVFAQRGGESTQELLQSL